MKNLALEKCNQYVENYIKKQSEYEKLVSLNITKLEENNFAPDENHKRAICEVKYILAEDYIYGKKKGDEFTQKESIYLKKTSGKWEAS